VSLVPQLDRFTVRLNREEFLIGLYCGISWDVVRPDDIAIKSQSGPGFPANSVASNPQKNHENQPRQGFSQATKDRTTAASARLTASEA